MKKRHPFFLLEVLIAVILVGGFAYLSIHGAFRVIYQQRKLLKAIEDSIDADRNRMKVIADYWNKVESLLNKEVSGNFKVSRKEAKNGKYYLLEIEDIKSKEAYNYLVTF